MTKILFRRKPKFRSKCSLMCNIAASLLIDVKLQVCTKIVANELLK